MSTSHRMCKCRSTNGYVKSHRMEDLVCAWVGQGAQAGLTLCRASFRMPALSQHDDQANHCSPD
jgi:hypothetical protein